MTQLHFFKNGKTLFYWPLPRMLYRLCKNIYRLHVLFVFLTSVSIYNYNRGLIKTLKSKENRLGIPSVNPHLPP